VGAIERANHLIHAASMRLGDYAGMGTTIAAALVVGSRLVLAHVGDSRIYRLRGGRLEALTEDHSLFNDFIRMGLADPDRPEDFGHRNVITRSLGPEPMVEVDAREIDLQAGDTYLLCSDGLHGPVPPNEIKGILGGPDLHAAVRHLIERANARGGPDNVTAVVFRADGG
jgi:protein phosphatase